MYKNLNSGVFANEYVLSSQCYPDIDLCTQAQISADLASGEDTILSRMESLRAFAKAQRSKKVRCDRLQTSFRF